MNDEKKDPRETMTTAVLDRVEPLDGAPHLAVLRIRPQEGETPDFRAGNACPVAFEHDGEVAVRWYSVASAPEQKDALEFFVVDPGKGGASGALLQFPAGTPMWFGAPVGKFTLDRSDRKHVALLGNGTGLAPYVSMLRHLRAVAQGGGGVDSVVTLWHGARTSAALGFRDELEALEKEGAFDFRYVPCVSRPDEDDAFDPSRLTRGRADEALARLLGFTSPGDDARGAELCTAYDAAELAARHPAGETAIFLCGNPEMIQAFDKAVEGSPYHEHLVYERWW